MKIGKILILAMLVSSLLVISISSVVAVDEYEVITDGTGDVVDFVTQETVDDHTDIDVENIDITELKYEREDKSVTLTLKVDGIIENRGELSDISEYGLPDDLLDLNVNTVGYVFMLLTSNDTYQIAYANNTCQVVYLTEFEIINLTEDDFSVDVDTLTISFEVGTTNETYESISVTTLYQKFSLSDLEGWEGEDPEGLEGLVIFLSDEAPNQPLVVDAYAPNLGEVGKTVEFEGLALYGQPPYTYNWDFGDGSTPSSEKNPTHVYEKPGKYNYTLTITDSSDFSDSFTETIEISGDSGEDDEGNPILIFVGIIIVIAIIGVIAVVYIIRR